MSSTCRRNSASSRLQAAGSCSGPGMAAAGPGTAIMAAIASAPTAPGPPRIQTQRPPPALSLSAPRSPPRARSHWLRGGGRRGGLRGGEAGFGGRDGRGEQPVRRQGEAGARCDWWRGEYLKRGGNKGREGGVEPRGCEVGAAAPITGPGAILLWGDPQRPSLILFSLRGPSPPLLGLSPPGELSPVSGRWHCPPYLPSCVSGQPWRRVPGACWRCASRGSPSSSTAPSTSTWPGCGRWRSRAGGCWRGRGGSGTPLGSPIIWEHWGPTSVFCIPLLNSNFQAEPGLMPKKPSQRRRLRKRQSSSLREESELTRRRWVRRLVLGLQGEIRI